MKVKKTRLMTGGQLIKVLEQMIEVLKDDDSFEGRISYTCFNGEEHETIPPNMFEVNAFFRVGNKMGQGGSIATLHFDDSLPESLKNPKE